MKIYHRKIGVRMATAHFIGLILLFQIFETVRGTCVFESEFGFILNCNFKKSSLFRVRNLGGVKAHFGLGFSLGDELGFGESLGNLEGNKRRSLGHFDNIIAANDVGVLPATKLTPSTAQTKPKQPQTSVTQEPIPTSTRAPVIFKKHAPLAMTEAKSLPLGVPPFRPIKLTDSLLTSKLNHSRTSQNIVKKAAIYHDPKVPTNSLMFNQRNTMTHVHKNGDNVKLPAFQALPSSVSRISTGEIIHLDDAGQTKNYNQRISQMKNALQVDQLSANSQMVSATDSSLPDVDLKGHTVEELAAVANVSVNAIRKAIEMRRKQLITEREEQMKTKGMNEQDFVFIQSHLDSLKETSSQTRPKPTDTTIYFTSSEATTSAPVVTPAEIITKKNVVKKAVIGGGSKVMNAPKEYYPVGYEKNFDDNFATKVDLPATTFHCGDQKHFPGLYGDMDLGCMVFHVCALTDDGLIMKSFLCPESTLFDQTILKCNWWFYVDCKSSKNLYDSNLPVSKSYQLMKALTFFSNFKKKTGNDTDSEIDIEALKNSVNAKGL